MDIRERAAAALVCACAAGIPVPAIDPPHRQRLRAALTRDIAALLAVPAGHVVVGDDPLRTYGGVPGQLISVEDPGDPDVVLRFLPETGNSRTGGGAYLLLAACPGCGGDPHSGDDWGLFCHSRAALQTEQGREIGDGVKHVLRPVAMRIVLVRLLVFAGAHEHAGDAL